MRFSSCGAIGDGAGIVVMHSYSLRAWPAGAVQAAFAYLRAASSTAREMMIFWTSEVPAKIRRIRASRTKRSNGRSRM
ncbi:hypothetical protein D9M71_639090 [compost metagenome]